MEVMPSYKQTEVGVIPEQWHVAQLGQCLYQRPSYGINAPALPYSYRLPTYVRITDITAEGRLSAADRVSVTASSPSQYYLSDGDLVFARTGASVGKSYRYRAEDGPLVYAGFLICMRVNQNVLLPDFLSAYVSTSAYWQWVRLMSMRSGQPGINGKEFTELPIPLPPLPEQRAIATALTDVDDLLTSLDRLIAKKRAIKQGVMHDLLTGRKRLPGFSGEWEVRRLGTLGNFLKGKGIAKCDANTGSIPCVRYGEIYTKHSDLVRQYFTHISARVASQATRLQRGDILFAGSGETKAEIGKSIAIVDDTEAYAGGDIVILRTTAVHPQFAGYVLNMPYVSTQKAARGQGDAVVHISPSALADVHVALPPLKEQRAIAAVLTDLDDEIDALQARRDKTHAIKQAMMHELLTGRTRLV